MLVTTFYLAMTFINAWRMRSLKSHLLKFMSWKSSAVLYKFSSGTDSYSSLMDYQHGISDFIGHWDMPVLSNRISPLKAKLIIERKVHYITDVIEITEETRMCRLRPIQFIDINRWFSMADGLPLWTRNIFQEPDSSPKLCVFIECEMEPRMNEAQDDIVPLESLGQVWAWRADKNLEFIVVIPFNKLLELSYKFLYGSLIINEKLPVTRIQTVYATGVPYQPDDDKLIPIRKIVNESNKQSHETDWTYYSAILKQLYREVFSHLSKTSISTASNDNNGSYNTAMPSQLESSYPTYSESTTQTNNVIHSDERLSQEPMQELTQESIIELSQELITESIPIQELKQKLKTEKTLPRQKKIQDSVQEQKPEFKTDQVLHRPENNQESIQKTTREQKQETETVAGRLPELTQEPIQKQQQKSTQESLLKLSRSSTPESAQETTVEVSNTIVRSETVAIRQKLSPIRKRDKGISGKVATTIESVTTHRRVTTLVPPQEKQTASISETAAFNASSVERSKRQLPKSTALNVLVYSESLVAKNNLIATLKNVLDPVRYTIYPVSLEVLCEGAWRGKVAMIAVVGNTGDATPFLLRYFLDGGRLLAICSDLLQSVVPYYRTAEIRENEIVQFSYDEWKAVKMKHHVLCFQASPAKKQFSSESDRHVMEHELVVDVLANEETWRTPSLIQVVDDTKNGVSIFSQIHLETNPVEYLGEEGAKYNKNRYEILFKILGDIISLHVKDTLEMPVDDYTEGYFFGDEKTIRSYLSGLSTSKGLERFLKIRDMEIEWLLAGQKPTRSPSEKYMPVRVLQIPEAFCYETYRKNLTSKAMGRVLLYSSVVGSTGSWGALPLAGLAVVAMRQRAGRGRAGNAFISPPGQAILSLQVWKKLDDTIALTQNIAALAAVLAIRRDTPYEQLNIRIKWPNDIYYGRTAKIGGIMTTADVMADTARINMGIGVNISNSVPTTCVNDIIREYNTKNNAHLEEVTIEWFLGRFCSHFERILDGMGTEDGRKAFFEEYYKYWLHGNEKIGVSNKDGTRISGVVFGMDGSGFLVVDTHAGRRTVNPDGNSFDLMANLIVTKY